MILSPVDGRTATSRIINTDLCQRLPYCMWVEVGHVAELVHLDEYPVPCTELGMHGWLGLLHISRLATFQCLCQHVCTVGRNRYYGTTNSTSLSFSCRDQMCSLATSPTYIHLSTSHDKTHDTLLECYTSSGLPTRVICRVCSALTREVNSCFPVSFSPARLGIGSTDLHPPAVICT